MYWKISSPYLSIKNLKASKNKKKTKYNYFQYTVLERIINILYSVASEVNRYFIEKQVN